MPLQATSGAASYDAFGGGVAAVPTYIEEVFSTYLYAGNESTQAIPNGIDLSTKGGLVWLKARDIALSNWLFDTQRGSSNRISSNSTSAQASASGWINSFDTNGFTLGSNGNVNGKDAGTSVPYNYVSWTFRKQPKFFDVVTYTGDGVAGRNITHNLGSVPGCIIVKATSTTSVWYTWHIGSGITSSVTGFQLNTTAAAGLLSYDVTGEITSTFFDTGSVLSDVGGDPNINGVSYVAYLFAHNAGGFGLTGTDNVISCGSFTDTSTGGVVDLGYEPQFVLVKSADVSGQWFMLDTMRGWINDSASGSSGQDKYLFANSSGAEGNYQMGEPTATGFRFKDNASGTYIYIAIRRGPMKVPTSGTSVYNAVARTGNNTNTDVTGVGFPVDWCLVKNRTGTSKVSQVYDRLRGAPSSLETWTTGAEASFATSLTSFALMDGVSLGDGNGVNQTGETYINYFYRRAPSFMDVVCYTGVDSGDLTLNHNLSVPYEMLVIKRRSGVGNWFVLSTSLTDATKYIRLNTTNGQLNAGVTVQASTNTTFLAPAGLDVTVSGSTYVAYLFATCAGVSKVGSYTGNGTTQTINCGFGAGGARFVLIKRSDSTGGWYVYDTARGMTTLTDPYLLMNTDDVEVATLGSVTTVSTGFALDSTILAAINVSGGTYIFLAIA